MEVPFKVKIYPKNIKLIEKSGIGRAIKHQHVALRLNNIDISIESDFDIVHVNTYTIGSLLFAKKCKRKKKKVIIYAHSTEEDFRNSFIFSNALSSFLKQWLILVYNQADLIITPTPYSKKLLVSYGIKPEIIPLSNGIDTNKFCYDKMKEDVFRATYGFQKDDKIVMSVGLHIKRKGIFDFIEIAKQLPDYQFVWCGYTNPNILPKDTKEALKTKLPNLHFVGYIEDMVSAYCAADLFFMPSYEETEGIVVLEALSMRLPIVLRDIEVYKPWLTNGDSCYMGKNNDEFKTLIETILHEGAPVDMLEKAHRVAEDRDIHKIGLRLKEIYSKLLGIK